MAYQPKSYKKFVATAATATLVATAVAPTALAADFTDVNANYKNAVDYLVDQGITQGLTETTFGVTSPIKRGDAAIMIAKALGLNTTTAPDAGFTDVNARVAGAVNAIVAAGIASGKTSTTFAPDLYITRQETAKIIANAYGLTGSGTTKFADVNSNWAPFVSALEEAGIAQGLNETTFGATNDVTRGQFALFLYRAEGQPYEVATVESLTFNDEGNQFVLKFAEALPEGADLNYVLENYTVLLNGAAPTAAQVEALKLSATVSADRKTVTVNHTDLDNLASALGGTSVTLSIGGKSDTHVFEVDPKVNSISVVNAKELQITFNLPIKEASVIDNEDDLIEGIFSLNSTDARGLVKNAYLSADGKVLTLVANDETTWLGSFAAELVKDKVEATNGKKVAEFKTFLSGSDTTRPTFSGVTYEPNGAAKFTFSEPLDETNSSIATKLVVSGPTTVASVGEITLAADKKSFTVVLPEAMTKDAAYTFTFTGLKDFANNLLSPNPLSATVVKSDRDTTKPTVTNVTALDTGKLQVTFSERIQTTGAQVQVSGSSAATSYTLDSTGTIATFTSVEGLTNGVRTVTITGARDLAGLSLDSTTRVIQVSADTTAPAYVSHTVETVGADRFLVVNYNEEVTANTGVTITGTYVDQNSVTRSIADITGAANISTGSDKRSVRIKLPTTAGNYTVNLPASLALDTSANNNASAARSVSFTVGAAVDSTKPVVTGFVQNGNSVTVTFDRAVTATTALNVNNYSIDGISSPFSAAIFDGNDRTVRLTLKDDVITTNGVRNYTVANVATSAGSVMEVKTATYDFKENIRPTVLSARLLSGTQIELTLSEAIKADTVGGDFDVFQGTSTTALAENGPEALSATNKVVVTLETPLTSLTGLTVKASSTINLADTNGNVVNFVGPIAVTN